MAVLEDLASSDDEDAASRADRAASAPNMSFDDMLKQAGEIKQRQMRDKRRAWEATAEFMKNTIAYDKNETYLDLRSNATVADRVAFAEPIKAEGNALFAEEVRQGDGQVHRGGRGAPLLEPRRGGQADAPGRQQGRRGPAGRTLPSAAPRRGSSSPCW